jgi:glyoxylase-like metal-dependent hydrolase (beta-lactamase superfamily II)
MFPKAKHIVHRADWDVFHRPEVQAAFPFEWIEDMATPIERLGALELIDDEFSLTDELKIVPTPGHTPGSVSIEVASGQERAIMWGDAFVHPATVTEPEWGFSFEMDMDSAKRTRRALLERIEASGMKVIACHFPEPGFGTIVRLDGKRYWQGL